MCNAISRSHSFLRFSLEMSIVRASIMEIGRISKQRSMKREKPASPSRRRVRRKNEPFPRSDRDGKRRPVRDSVRVTRRKSTRRLYNFSLSIGHTSMRSSFLPRRLSISFERNDTVIDPLDFVHATFHRVSKEKAFRAHGEFFFYRSFYAILSSFFLLPVYDPAVIGTLWRKFA